MKIAGIQDGKSITSYDTYDWHGDAKREMSGLAKERLELSKKEFESFKRENHTCGKASVSLLNERAARKAHWVCIQGKSEEDRKSFNNVKYRLMQEMEGKIVCIERDKLCVFDYERFNEGSQMADCITPQGIFDKSFGSKYAIPFLKWFWAEVPRARGFMFNPGKPLIANSQINLWRGWGRSAGGNPDNYEGHKEQVALWNDHIKNVLCGGVEEHAIFVHKWLAHLLQFPATLPRQMLCFSGAQRIGKSLAFEIIAETIGENLVYQTQESQGVLGRFTEAITGKMLVILDEGIVKTFLKDEDARSRLRGLVASKWIDMEGKYQARRQIQNFLRCVAITNSDAVVQLAANERRYTLIRGAEADYYEANGIDKIEYIKKLKGINRQILFNYYWHYYLGNVDFELDRPESDGELIRSSFLSSMGARDRAIFAFMNGDLAVKYPPSGGMIDKIELMYDMNKKFEKANWEGVALGMSMKKYCVPRTSHRTVKTGNGMPAYNLIPLKEAQRLFAGTQGIQNIFEEEEKCNTN